MALGRDRSPTVGLAVAGRSNAKQARSTLDCTEAIRQEPPWRRPALRPAYVGHSEAGRDDLKGTNVANVVVRSANGEIEDKHAHRKRSR